MKKLLKTKQDKIEFLNFVGFLLADALPQGTNSLQDSHGGYCCLGVGCVVTIPPESIEGNSRLYGDLPVDQRAAPKWLKELNNNFNKRTGLKLSHLNDVERNTFPQIGEKLLLVYQGELKR